MDHRHYTRKQKIALRAIILALVVIALIVLYGVVRMILFPSKTESITEDPALESQEINRIVTVYGFGNKPIQTWKGRISIKENDFGNKLVFTLDGKEKSVYNAIVIIENTEESEE